MNTEPKSYGYKKYYDKYKNEQSFKDRKRLANKKYYQKKNADKIKNRELELLKELATKYNYTLSSQ